MAKTIMIDRKKLEAFIGKQVKTAEPRPINRAEPMRTPPYDENRANPNKEDSISNALEIYKVTF